MEHAHDNILAAFLEPGTIPELAKRVNMSLASLATWTNKNIDLLEGVHKLLITRSKLIKAHLELASLTALAAVSSATTDTDDPKLRERALERQRKAAVAILRHKPGGTGFPDCAPTPAHGTGSPACAPTPARGTGVPPVPTSPTSSASSNAQWRVPNGVSSPNVSSSPRKLSISERLAARRLAALATT